MDAMDCKEMDCKETDYKTKTAWLRRYRDSLRQERILRQECAELNSRACKVTPALRAAPGGGDGQALPRAVERLICARQELQAQIGRCGGIRREVAAAINQVQDPRDHEILYRRYILGQRFEQIAAEMPLEYRWVRRRHKRVIECIQLKIGSPCGI